MVLCSSSRSGKVSDCGPAVAVDVEQHVHQRQPARVARHRQLLEQRAVGAASGARRRRAARCPTGAPAPRRAGAASKLMRIGSRLTQWPTRLVMALGIWPAAAMPITRSSCAGQPVQRRGEAAEHRREQADAGAARETLRRPSIRPRVEQVVDAVGAEGAHRRAADGRSAVPAPAGCRRRSARARSRCATACRGWPLPGPPRRRSRNSGPPAQRRAGADLLGIQLAEVLADDAPRPAVADRVVRGHHQQVVERRTAGRARRGTAGPARAGRVRAIACLAVFLEPALLGGRVEAAQVDLDQVQRRGLADQQLRAVRRDGRAQRFVALDQPVQRHAQGARVQRALEPQPHRLVVGQRGFGAQLVAQPDLALRLGGRDDALDRSRRRTGRIPSAAPAAGD